ncbi:oligosaccharyl transferase subunit ost3/OST6 [Dispira simplex]|nr:oligosaccharyl transferase subunit ost3/OST6 [Dispira simplex]
MKLSPTSSFGRLTHLVGVVLALTLVILFANGVTADDSTDFQTKIHAMRAKANHGQKPIPLLKGSLTKMVTEPSRQFGAVVLFTSLTKQFDCGPCQDFQSAYQLVTQSWTKTATQPDDLVFFMADVAKISQEILQQLNINNIPHLLYYPPNEPGQTPARLTDGQALNLMQTGMEPGKIVQLIGQQAGHEFHLYKPFDWTWAAMVTTGVVLGGFALVFVLPQLQFNFHGLKVACSAFVIVTTMVMCSGYMFVKIRNMPFISQKGNQLVYVLPHFQQQLGVETQIVTVLYSLCGVLAVALVNRVPKFQSPVSRNVGACIIMGLLLVTYSALIVVFRQKYPHYPYHLFL